MVQSYRILKRVLFSKDQLFFLKFQRQNVLNSETASSFEGNDDSEFEALQNLMDDDKKVSEMTDDPQDIKKTIQKKLQTYEGK